MPWYFPWSESIKKRACRYLLQHYLGQFLQEKLTLDQLSVDLYNGTGKICDLNLDVVSLNKCLDEVNFPIEIVDGFIKSITATIPWSTLTSDNTVMEISGLELTLQPKESANSDGMTLDSMFSSMTTSMQLAEECLRQDAAEGNVTDNAQPMEGLEMFAQTIESVLSRVKVTLVNTVIRLEHTPAHQDHGVALEVRIKRIEYFDDQATSDTNFAQPGVRNVYEPAAVCYKNFYMMGVSFYADRYMATQHSLLQESITSVRTTESGASVIDQDEKKTYADETELIQIAVLTGRQEMKVKLKQCDAVPGPKLEVNLHVGSIHSILSPNYVHILLTLMSSFQNSSATSPGDLETKTTNKPMGSIDFERVEDELQRQLRESHRAQIATNMLPTDVYDDTDLEESVTSEGMYYSLHQNHVDNSDMTSSVGSSASASTIGSSIMYNYGTGYQQRGESPFTAAQRRRSRVKSNVQKLLEDPGADITRYKLKFSFFSLILLHEDPPDTPSDGIEPGVPGYEKMKELVRNYLEKVANFPVHGMDTSLLELRQRFAVCCPHDHMSLLCKPISLECDAKHFGGKKSTLSADLSVGVLEIVETLFDRTGYGLRPKKSEPSFEHSELLVFHMNCSPHDLPSLQTTPCLKLKIIDYTTSGRDNSSMDLLLETAPVTTELDITLIDRIHSVLSPAAHAPESARFYHAERYRDPTSNTTSDKKINFRATTGCVTLNVRFPIPDLRAGNAVDKLPWWKRTLHNEVLIVELNDFDFRTSYLPNDGVQTLEFSANDVHALFKEGFDTEPVSFLRASYGGPENDELPKLVIKIFPSVDRSLSEEREDSDDSLQNEFDDSACHFTKEKEPTPFSTRKVLHDNEEMIIPGDRNEIQDFKDKSSNNTRVLLEITLPNVNAFLPSKEFYELVYNRVNGDLLLWVPQAPSPLNVQASHNTYSIQPHGGLDLANQVFYEYDEYLPCKSAIQYDSSSESEDDSLGPEHAIYARDNLYRSKQEKNDQKSSQNRMCINLSIGFGKITVCTPVLNEDKSESTEERGELLLEVEDGNLFLVDKGMRSLCMSVSANRAALFHDGARQIRDTWPHVGRATVSPTNLNATIYQSDAGIPTKQAENIDMVSVAIRVQPEQLNATTSSKEFLVAFALNGATLRHRMSASKHSWLMQILDFLDVRDFPVRGYTLPKIVTVLHCHIWNCAIDYRPLYLPSRCLVTLGNFSISSNIIAKSNMSLLKFILEDGTLSLSQNAKTATVNAARDYVCILEVGLFELSLLTSDGRDWKCPKMDLKATNNIIHIRTCADSCLALRQLILYITNYGDLADDFDLATPMSNSTNTEPEQEIPAEHLEQVHDMMADAMLEASPPRTLEGASEPSQNRRPSLASGTEVFFFPDEQTTSDDVSSPESGQVAPPVEQTFDCEADDEPDDEEEEVYSDDEDFCIIDDPGLGISPRDGEPTIRILTEEPLLFKENHFVKPYGKVDILRAPESFPSAIYRYTLKEMSVVWHMYGGEDFKQGTPAKVTMVGPRVAYGKPQPEKAKLPWRVRGGPFRDQGTLMQLYLNKIRLQHEIYPDITTQASRQIFIVNEIEIRDKLVSSQINKFLYHYTSDQMPRQSHANMVLVKNVHLRPDIKMPNTTECSLKISVLPLRLNIDQDSLIFLRRFVLAITADDEDGDEVVFGSCDQPRKPEFTPTIADQASSPPKNAPVMGSPSQNQPSHADQVKFDELSDSQRSKTPEPISDPQPTFFKTFVFSPDVLIRLDYHGKRLTMGQNTTAGLLAGLAQLNCSEFRLKRIVHRKGLLGVDRLFLFAANEWLSDIKKNQLPGILGGVGPMHTVVQLFQGVKDLFWLPVEQYRKDGRILRGLQRGANSFTTSTLMAALELTNRTVQSVQYVAELAYDMVSPASIRHSRRKQITSGRRQPGDFREGVNNAYLVLKDGISDTAHTIIRAAQKEHDIKGVTGAVGGVLRQIPPTVVQPFILATEATSNVLGGMRNQLLPDVKREEDEKWKQDIDD